MKSKIIHRDRLTLCGLIAVAVWGALPSASGEKQRLDPADVLMSHRIPTDPAGLIAGLRHSNLLVRVSAAQVAGERAVQATADALVATLSDDAAMVRFAVAEALLRLGSRKGVPVLAELIEGTDREVAVYAAAALCNAGDSRGCVALAGSLKDSEWLIRKTSVLSIAASTNVPNRVQLLTLAAGDSNQKVRLAALQALAEDGDKSTVPLLISRLRDPDQVVRYGANKWLRELTGQSFGFQSAFPENAREEAVKRWESWWQNNQADFTVRKRSDK